MVGYSSGGRWDAGSRLLERLRFRSSRRPRSEYFSSALNSSSSAAAFIDQKDFTYYTPNQLSTLRCHSFELGDGCLLRRTRLQQQSSGSGQKSPTSPVNDIVCDVCHQQISTSSTTGAYYTCQVCGYVSHDRCLSQADNTCPTCLTRQPSTFFKTLSSSHLIPSSPEAVHAISLQPVSAVKSLVDMPSEFTMLTSSYQQQSMSARPNVKLHNRRWSSSTTAMPNSDDDRLTLMELGLTYITERIIALTCPLECPEPVYRSGLRDLFKMLQTKHANNFMIVNLSERIEEMHSISQKVLDFGWPDMLAPPLNRLCSICKSVESWLNASSQNVVVFHCKTGLSRLAVVVSALIDYIKLCPDAAITTTAASTSDRKIQSLDYYAMKRFYETKLHSSTMPSQRRYIHYLSGLLTGSIRLNNNPVYLQRIAVLGLRDVDGRTQWNMSSSSSHCQLFVKIYQNLQPIFTSANTHLSIGDSSSTVIVLDTPVQLRCDVLVKCYEIASVAPGRTTTSNMLLQQERQLMFWCQFHVSAVTPDSTVVFTRKDLDEVGQSYLFTDSVRFEMELSSTPQPTSYNYSSGGSSGLVNSSAAVNAAGIGGQRNVLERCNSYEQFTELLRGNNFFDTVASFQPISVVSVDDGTAALPHHDQVLRRQKQQRLERQPVGNASGHVANSHGDVVANESALFSRADGNLHTTTFHQQQQQQLRVEKVLKGEKSEQFVSRLTPAGGAARLVYNGKMTESAPERISPASKTTEELEEQHNELDSVLRNLLTQEIKSISPSTVHQRGTLMSAETFDTQTVTSQRTRELTPTTNYHHQQQQQVVVAAETIERPTYHRKVTSSQSFDCGIATAADKKLVTGGEDRAASGGGGVTDDDNCYRSYLSDSEDQLAWLQEQRNRLQQHVRKSAAWRSKTKQEKQLVSELRSAQNALATLRSRAQSESDSLDWQTGDRRTPVDSRYSTEYSGADDYSRYSRRTSLSSSRQDRCDVQPDPHYESGPDRERPVPVTTLQTTYTFAVGPHHRTASLDHGLSSSNYSTLNRSLSPRVPDRTASSHDVMVTSDQTVSETVEKTLVKNQLVEQMNKLSMTSLEAKTKPFEVIEEEVISLVPIGRGVQNIEPDATQPNGLFVRSGRMASSLSVPSSLSLVRGVSPSATSAAAVALGSQSTLTYQQVQMRPFGTTTATSNNLLGSNQTLRQSRSFTGDQQEFERQMLLQQQQLDAQQELKRRNDIQRQEEFRRSEELQRQQELLRQEEMKRLEELQRLEETRRQQEMLRQEELRRSEELQRQQELLRQEEMKRLEELQRLEETRRQQELLRQEELRRSEELQRQQELLRQEEMKRLEETRRQQEMLRQEELRRSEELRRQEELQRQQELIRQEQLKRHQLLEFENQLQLQHFQVQQQAMIREEQVSKQVGVTSSVPPLPTQSNSSNNCYQTITAVSSVSYQTTNRHLAETGHNLPVDVEMVQNSLSVPEQASAGNVAIRTVSASSADVCEFSSTTPRFVYDTSKIWHRPNVSRDEAINFLKDKPAGSFVIRNSSTFHGSFGLAVKVSQLPANVQPKGGDLKSALVRHFLIETTSKGVRLKGCSNEPTFGSLAALVYQHSITPLALPCKLLLPELNDLKDIDFSPIGSTSRQLVQQEAACNVIYVNSTDVESLTGAVAISKAIENTFLPGQNPPNTTVVRFKVSAQGITLTDNQRKLFFRRHYPLNSVTYCGLDRQDKRMKTFDISDTATVTGRLFGFVARKQNSVTENACHLFAEMDSSQPASAIVNFVERMLSEHGHVLG